MNKSRYEHKEKCYINDNEYYYNIVSKNIRKLRLEQNLTQQDLADMTELSREYIYDIESETRKKFFTLWVVGRIAEALGVDIKDLFNQD